MDTAIVYTNLVAGGWMARVRRVIYNHDDPFFAEDNAAYTTPRHESRSEAHEDAMDWMNANNL